MPRYFYKCSKCNSQFKTVHGITEKQDHCDICFSSGCLTRIPQLTSTLKPPSDEAKRVREAIEENKQIFKEMEKEARSQTYDD